MKTLRVKQIIIPDLELEFEDEDLELMTEIMDRDFPEVEYEIIEKAASLKD